jgi:hypothetical protein
MGEIDGPTTLLGSVLFMPKSKKYVKKAKGRKYGSVFVCFQVSFPRNHRLQIVQLVVSISLKNHSEN